MNLYHRNKLGEIWLGDCRDLTNEVDIVDLIVTDPPYGQNYESGRGKMDWGKIEGDMDNAVAFEGLTLSLKKLRRGRHIYYFGPKLEIENIAASIPLVWDKGIFTMGSLEIPWGKSHEEVHFGVHQPSKANRAQGFGKGAARMRRGSVLRVQRIHAAAATNHPTEKPVPLLRDMIESSSLSGEVVFDPFCGSGSTLIAAALEGRYGVGIEIEERYCETAAERLENVVVGYEPPKKERGAEAPLDVLPLSQPTIADGT